MGFDEYGDQVHTWLEGVYANRGVNRENTLDYCNKILEYAQADGDEKLLGFAYYYKGETYYLMNDVDKLFGNISGSLTYLENTDQHELVARAYNLLAITSVNRGNAPFAMDYYLSALACCEKHGLKDVAVMIDINIGTLYNQFGEYRKAQGYFERAHQMLLSCPQRPDYYTLLMSVYTGMGNSCLHSEQLLKAQEYEDRVRKECLDYLTDTERTCFLCFQARLYHSMGKQAQRDDCIAQIKACVNETMTLLDVFEDFYEYCEMLFSIGYYDELSDLLRWLEQQAKKMKIVYMQKRLLVFRIRYYRIKEEQEKYLDACAAYYELTELSEQENRYMMGSVLDMRHALQETSRRRQVIEQENRLLQRKSETDALTGLANRFRLNDVSEEAFERALERKQGLAVEILDIDYFKQYNDNYGHQAGDVCIRQIASVLKKMEKKGHILCARYGGDEFIVLYEDCTKERVLELAEELKQTIMGLKLEHRYSQALPIVTISQGICYDVPQSERKAWDFLHTADKMLYKGKKISRNSICIGHYGEE